MSFINTYIGTPLGWIMYLCYRLVRDYGIAILLFTFLSKIILLPLSIVVQKNSIKMIRLQPEINRITAAHYGDKDAITDATMVLYKREKYSPMLGMVPMIIQILLVLGLIQVIYNPMQHLLHIAPDLCDTLVNAATALRGVEHLGSGAQLKTMQMLADPANYDYFMDLGIPGLEDVIAQTRTVDMHFLGIDLGAVPKVTAVFPAGPGADPVLPFHLRPVLGPEPGQRAPAGAELLEPVGREPVYGGLFHLLYLPGPCRRRHLLDHQQRLCHRESVLYELPLSAGQVHRL